MLIRFFIFLLCASHGVFVCAGKTAKEIAVLAKERKKANCESAEKSRKKAKAHIAELEAALTVERQCRQELEEKCAAAQIEYEKLKEVIAARRQMLTTVSPAGEDQSPDSFGIVVDHCSVQMQAECSLQMQDQWLADAAAPLDIELCVPELLAPAGADFAWGGFGFGSNT